MPNKLNQVLSSKCFGGYQNVYTHHSDLLDCDMKFSVYIPPDASETNKVPVIYFLSGVQTSVDDIIYRTGFQRYASEHNVCVVGPDTGPRGTSSDYPYFNKIVLASFYVDVYEGEFAKHFKMFSYITKELIDIIEENFSFVEKGNRSIFGHSMGGHGAIMISLKRPDLFVSCSALAPPYGLLNTSVGKRSLTAFFGKDMDQCKRWELVDLIADYKGPNLHLRVDQGAEDSWILNGEFKPHRLIKACSEAKFPIDFRLHQGYDHGWHFVSTFIGEHIKHHSDILRRTNGNLKKLQNGAICNGKGFS